MSSATRFINTIQKLLDKQGASGDLLDLRGYTFPYHWSFTETAREILDKGSVVIEDYGRLATEVPRLARHLLTTSVPVRMTGDSAWGTSWTGSR